MQGLSLLSLAIWVPIVAGLAVLDRRAPTATPQVARVLALVGAVLGFLVTIPLYIGFDPHARGFQFVQVKPWIEAFNVNYHLGHRRHLAAADPAQQLHDGARRASPAGR